MCGVLLLVCSLGSWSSAQAGSSFKVGSFTKTTAGAPASQVVAHGLGETPKALILWTASKTSESLSADFGFAVGFTDGSTDKSAAASSWDDRSVSETGRRIANKALTIIRRSAELRAEADLTAWDTTNFSAHIIHFIAIGGSDVSAKTVGWTMKTSPGNQAITGVGFQPDVVLHMHAGNGFTSSVPASQASAGFGLGVMDADGDQWANAIFSLDGQGTSDTQVGQQTDACILATGGVRRSDTGRS